MKIFNRPNLNKVILIFIFGFSTRALVYHIYNVNVFVDYLNLVSILYYFIFSMFIVLLHEIVNYFDINIIPSFSNLYTNFSNLINFVYKGFVKLNKMIFTHKLEEYKISSIKKVINHYLESSKKITLGLQENNDSVNKSSEKTEPKMSNVLQKNNKSDGSDYKSSSSSTKSKVIRRSPGNSNIRGSSNNSSSYSNSSNSSPNSNNNSTMYDYSVNPTIENSIRPYTGNRLYYPNDLVFSPTSSIYSNSTNGYLPINSYEVTSVQARVSTIPRTPIYSTLTTPETMSPLFPSVRSSFETNSIRQTNNYNVNPHPYLVPANVPYFDPDRASCATDKATLGLNASLERLWLRNEDNPGPASWTTNPDLYFRNSREGIWHGSQGRPSVDWTQKKDVVISNYNHHVLNENKGLSSKIAVDNITPSIPNEVVLHNSKMGKIKLAFKFMDNQVGKTYSNMENIAVKYHDKSKRKFVWVLWEKNSGMYESYEDFKNSWDPKTSIWTEIKNRTRKDIQADVEGILNLKNRKAIGHNVNKRIEPIAKRPTVRGEVNTLLENSRPFVEPVNEHTEGGHNKHSHKNNENHSSRNKHSSRTSKSKRR